MQLGCATSSLTFSHEKIMIIRLKIDPSAVAVLGKTYDKARNALALALSPVVRALVDPDGALRDIRDLDSISFSDWFMSKGGTRASIQRMWDPVAYALGFIDCDNISARCMLTIFALFATKTEASLLRMLKGFISGGDAERYFIRDLLILMGDETYVTGIAMSKASCSHFAPFNILLISNPYYLSSRQLRQAAGLNNLLYTPDADFSCFADLALTSPEDYYLEGQGSLLQ
ncbi:zeta-carotene desaturase [Actinidia rufa]|uniref:Zeta-carotene desaturase n=1 Tax=Actinidia rufa TaxID=165716 RepID=A0A7J0F1D0_9ERIC|nr:zeta-carotene desaturase [Actinidia rufa]